MQRPRLKGGGTRCTSVRTNSFGFSGEALHRLVRTPAILRHGKKTGSCKSQDDYGHSHGKLPGSSDWCHDHSTDDNFDGATFASPIRNGYLDQETRVRPIVPGACRFQSRLGVLCTTRKLQRGTSLSGLDHSKAVRAAPAAQQHVAVSRPFQMRLAQPGHHLSHDWRKPGHGTCARTIETETRS
jgi:hypothetical protein